mmetsp:Transcript_11545/g.44784  ORF Transcript_11545/g.44784 Transcript_11545/m.44784 type:complete len:236 (-) Transcript_11545:187-894(-)
MSTHKSELTSATAIRTPHTTHTRAMHTDMHGDMTQWTHLQIRKGRSVTRKSRSSAPRAAASPMGADPALPPSSLRVLPVGRSASDAAVKMAEFWFAALAAEAAALATASTWVVSIGAGAAGLLSRLAARRSAVSWRPRAEVSKLWVAVPTAVVASASAPIPSPAEPTAAAILAAGADEAKATTHAAPPARMTMAQLTRRQQPGCSLEHLSKQQHLQQARQYRSADSSPSTTPTIT